MRNNIDNSDSENKPEPLEKFVSLINDEIKSGTSKNDVINKLIQAGLDEENAKLFVNTIISTRKTHFLNVGQYLALSLAFFAILFSVIMFALSKDELSNITKYVFFSFIVLLILFGLLTEINGKTAAYLRYVVTHIFWLSTAALACLLFLQDTWVEPSLGIRGGAWAAIINLISHTIIFIGPFWFGIIFSIFSVVLILSAWATGDDIKNENYKVK